MEAGRAEPAWRTPVPTAGVASAQSFVGAAWRPALSPRPLRTAALPRLLARPAISPEAEAAAGVSVGSPRAGAWGVHVAVVSARVSPTTPGSGQQAASPTLSRAAPYPTRHPDSP